MKRFLDTVIALFRRIFNADLWSRLVRGVEATAPYLEVAYEIVKVAAEMTPNRTDDELMALAEHLGVPKIWQSKDKGQAIREIVYLALKWRLPDLPDRLIYRAIELAYGALRP